MYEILIMENEGTTGSSGWINRVKLYIFYNVEFQNCGRWPYVTEEKGEWGALKRFPKKKLCMGVSPGQK